MREQSVDSIDFVMMRWWMMTSMVTFRDEVIEVVECTIVKDCLFSI